MVGGGRCVLYQMMGNLFPVQWIASTIENASPDEFFKNAWLCYNVRAFVFKHKGMCLLSPLGTVEPRQGDSGSQVSVARTDHL